VELATLELKINYLEPVPGGTVKADAKVLRAGRNFIVTECEIFNESGSLAAKALLTFSAAAAHTLAK
jgi:acyl-CoA thioesterase